jgi:hypothetical protein
MIVIFTDIDGVLNPHWRKKWDKKAISSYNKLCKEFDLKPVITSTWRLNHTKEELQDVFINQGIDIKIFDYTPHLDQQDRGLEINEWLLNNKVDNYVVIDDRVFDRNVVKCRSWIGLTEEECDIIRNTLNYDR